MSHHYTLLSGQYPVVPLVLVISQTDPLSLLPSLDLWVEVIKMGVASI